MVSKGTNGSKQKKAKNAQKIEDELAFRKMKKISDEIKSGKRKVYTEEQVRKKYGWKK